MQLTLAGIPIHITLSGDKLQQILFVNFAHLSCAANVAPLISYQVVQTTDESYSVQSEEAHIYTGTSLADVVFYLEKDLIISTQLKSQGIMFFHAAALTWQDKTVMIVGESGAGKSSITWGLLQHGFKYLSDELVPITNELRVFPFQRAINLKQELSVPYQFPSDAVNLGRFGMVPVSSDKLESDIPTGVDLILFVKFDRHASKPTLTPLGRADAFMKLYANLLNGKAFSDYGMVGTEKILRTADVYDLTSVRDMQATVSGILQLLDS